ncbi:MAG: hypothetical protein H0X25_01240 [Acidobacteriales bacterium]|nr:hypothetical protein [Terriglobales bacterium]
MRTSLLSSCAIFGLLALLCALPGCSVNVNKDGSEDSKNVDIKTPMVGLHVGKDADARDIGLPLYPGSRKSVKKSDGDDQSANLSIATAAFGLKVIAVEFESDDSPQKIVDFYKDKLTQYGNVLECHSHDQGGNVNIDSGSDDSGKKKSKELKCEENDGPVIELKAGSKENQHLVSVKTEGKGTKFALVHVQTRGGDTI